jgi:hypothetical protein
MPSHTAPERCETLRREVAAGACSSPVVRSSRRQWAAGVRIMCHRGHGLAVRVRRNVISTERKDHIATVITDSGQRVTVLGTTAGFRNPSAPPIDATRWAGFTSFIRLMANRPTGTTSVPRLSNLRVRGFGRCRLRTISCPTGFPSTNKPDLWDICSSSVRLRQALCFSSWQVARSSSDSPLEPADSAVRIARTGREV